MSTVTRKLVAKELYVNRWLMVSATVAGVASVLFASLGKLAFNIGMLTWLTTIVAVGVMFAVFGIQNERKEHSLLFILSLPLSIPEYVRAKQLGLALCFLIPWAISSAAAVIFVLVHPDVPDGLLPFLTLLCLFMLTNFSLLLCGALHATSEAMTSGVIIVTNMAVTLFMFVVAAMPGIHQRMWSPTPDWNSTFWTVLTVELVTLALAFTLPFFVAARRRDFI
jgi:ABC-2 type transport system permease protein